ncbi:hypothetical protein HYY72_01800 [Candidatus Woesearchaeota archaeon]|nr:hypothetical protein [Candidatus Woesearchaeota archaeon]
MKYILPGLLIFSSFLVSGCLSVKMNANSWPPKDAQQCQSLPERASFDAKHTQDDCYSYVAAKSKNKDLCSKVSAIHVKDCEEKVSFAMDPISYCSNRATQAEKNNCFSGIASPYSDFDTQTKLTACANIGDNDCYINLAMDKEDKSICDKITTSETKKQECIDAVNIRTQNR